MAESLEGTASMMLNSLNKIKALPSNTLLYCAHEYTLDNCRFAMQIEPNNTKLQQRFKEVEELRRAKETTIPSSLQIDWIPTHFYDARARCDKGTSRYRGQRTSNEVAVCRYPRMERQFLILSMIFHHIQCKMLR